jgi:hypothetical protein
VRLKRRVIDDAKTLDPHLGQHGRQSKPALRHNHAAGPASSTSRLCLRSSDALLKTVAVSKLAAGHTLIMRTEEPGKRDSGEVLCSMFRGICACRVNITWQG